MSTKRPRIASQSSSASSASSSTLHPQKSSRTLDSNESLSHPLLCTLPPTCYRRPTPIANSKDLEIHYATYHAHVCEERGCSCVFPNARLLELHQTECHDPLAAMRKERGERTFACHLPECPRLFLTPKARRLHLIQAHSYPKEYFFAVTNKGVGGLLKRWGEGASLIRGPWKPRERTKVPEEQNIVVDDRDDEDRSVQSDDTSTTSVDINQYEESDGGQPMVIEAEVPKHDTNNSSNKHIDTPSVNNSRPDSIDILTDALSSLSLVPASIRFGRGGKNGGFVHARGAIPQGSRTKGNRGRGGNRMTRRDSNPSHTPSVQGCFISTDNLIRLGK